MICERCGRLLNRATGRCVCDDYGGAAPPPVALTHPPVDGPAPAVASAPIPAPPVVPPVAEAASPARGADDIQPISMAAAVAVLDLSDRPTRPAAPPVPATPPPPPPARAPGEAVGVLRRVRHGRRAVDAVVYEGRLVLARPGARVNLLAPQLAAQDPTSRVIEDGLVDEVAVREDAFGGRIAVDLRHGEHLVLTWSGGRNRRVSAEDLLTSAFPGKVDQGPSQAVPRALRLMAVFLVLAVVGFGAATGLSVLLRPDPPPPVAAAPPATLAPDERAARAALAPACDPWAAFAASVARGERPDPRLAGPLADRMRPAFDAAATAVPAYVAAREEVVYLQAYGRRPPADVARESSSRVAYALDTISAACSRAGSAP